MKKIDNESVWQEEMNNFLMSNFEWIEYCVAKRETMLFNTMFANYIRFPKAENGKMLTYNRVHDIADMLWSLDEDYKNQLIGQLATEANILNTTSDYYIIWNNLDFDEYDNLTGDELNKLYRY